jgi:hypothetical protein
MFSIGQYRVAMHLNSLLSPAPAPEAGAAGPARDCQSRIRWREVAAPYNRFDMNLIGAKAAAAATATDMAEPEGVDLIDRMLHKMGRIKPYLHFAVVVSGLKHLHRLPKNPGGDLIHLTFHEGNGSCERAVTIALHRKILHERHSRIYECRLPSNNKILFCAHVTAKRALVSWLNGEPPARPAICSQNHANSYSYHIAKAIHKDWTGGDLVFKINTIIHQQENAAASDVSAPPPSAIPAPAPRALLPSAIWRPF